jgi:sugar phosphate isomerase/epimerase
MRTTKRHQAPSRLRYETANPVIGVRVDRETYDRLLKLRERSGLSFGAIIRDALAVVEKDVERIREHGRRAGVELGRKLGYNDGWKEAKARYAVTFPCARCGKPIPLVAGSETAADAIAALAEHGWSHDECE